MMVDKVYPDVVGIEIRRSLLPRINYVQVKLKYYLPEPPYGLTEEVLDVRSVDINSSAIERVKVIGERGVKVMVSLYPNTVALYNTSGETLVITKQR